MHSHEILDSYLRQILVDGRPDAPAWNVERLRSGRKNSWNYIDGCMINALLELHEATDDPKYLAFCRRFMDAFIQEDGTITGYDLHDFNLDNINAGKSLLRLHVITGEQRYRRAADILRGQLASQPRTKEGVFWHKAVYPDQIWLDGLYMAQPFYLRYGMLFDERQVCADVIGQLRCARRLMRDARNGLYHHAYDATRQQFWCDPVTGLSSSFWLRAEGWLALALIDVWEILPADMSAERTLVGEMFIDLIESVRRYQDSETGMWHQVVNLPRIKPNYLEESGSALLAAAIMKGARLGVLDESYLACGRAAFDGICATCLSDEDGVFKLDGVCLVAGLGGPDNREGTFEYYMREPVVSNDAKGIAPLLLAYGEIHRRERC